ncbi:hypothetical protein GW17_00051660 [Ensete ventricosum]|nr:hypothetical protein GW17_00051660 [Ensete ventricosum]
MLLLPHVLCTSRPHPEGRQRQQQLQREGVKEFACSNTFGVAEVGVLPHFLSCHGFRDFQSLRLGESTTRSVERAPIEDKWKLVRPRRAISNLRFVRAESPNAVSSRPNLISSVHFVNDSVKPDHYNSTILSLSIRRSPEAYPSSNWISSMDPAISLHSSHVIRACTTFERHIIVTPMMPTACACVSNRTARTKRSSYRNAVALGEGCGFLLCFLKKNARSRS